MSMKSTPTDEQQAGVTDLILWNEPDVIPDPYTGDAMQVLRPVTADELAHFGDLDDYVEQHNNDPKLLHDLNRYGWRYVDGNGWQRVTKDTRPTDTDSETE